MGIYIHIYMYIHIIYIHILMAIFVLYHACMTSIPHLCPKGSASKGYTHRQGNQLGTIAVQIVTNIHTFRVIEVYSPPRKSNRHKDAEPVGARKFAAWRTACNSKTFGHYAVVCCYHIRQQGLWPLRCHHHCISTARPLAITL